MMVMYMHLNFHGAKISVETIQPNFYCKALFYLKRKNVFTGIG